MPSSPRAGGWTTTARSKRLRADALVRRGLRLFDSRPTTSVLAVVGGGTLVAELAYSVVCDGPILLGRVERPARVAFFGSLAATSGALLGFVITSLSILLTLPRDEAIQRLHGFRAWGLLNQALLVAAALLGATLLVSTSALVIDDGPRVIDWLQIPLTSLAVAAMAQLVTAGAAFAMVVLSANR